MGNTLVDYRTEAGVATIELCDPPMNALTYEMMKDLDDAIVDARFDNDVHALVITGYGDRFFSAGANVQMLSEVDPAFRFYFGLYASETLTRLENTPKLVIAALNGHTVGGGLEIALACDLRIARKGGGKLGLQDLSQGLVAGNGGAQRIARVVGKPRATQLILEGTNLDFERAQQLGLISEVWEAPSRDTFLGKVIEYARKHVTAEKAPAFGKLKRSLQAGLEMSIEQAVAFEREQQE
jgi:enoyl-CoA hydratase/carnithine racemase